MDAPDRQPRSGTDVAGLRGPTAGPRRAPPRPRRGVRRALGGLPPRAWIVVAAVLAAAVRLPFLGRALSSDEGGLLMVAAQWRPGTSLYGDYWVDRPPLLIALFRVADAGGGTVALRLLGIAVAVTCVLLAGWIGRLVAQRPTGPVYAAATAAVFVSTPLFDAQEIDGELLALPFLLAGTGCVLAAFSGRARHPARWWVAAGALGAAAALVKQNMIDVAVVAATALVLTVLRPGAGGTRRAALGRAARAGGWFALGALLVTAVVLGVADLLGTGPAPLWNALVEFRFHAAQVIASSAANTNDTRLTHLLGAFALSGAPLLVLLLLAALLRRRGDLPDSPTGPRHAAVLALAALGWEAVGIAGGGSFWWHYQIALITGLVLVAAVLADAGPRLRRGVRISLVFAAVVVAVGTVVSHGRVPGPGADAGVIHFLRTHARPGDTGVVAFGDPAILRATGLSSPYPQLWSLPVRVRDPHLRAFTRVLSGPDRPTWLVVFGAKLETWGVDATTAVPVLRQHYTRVATPGEFTIYEADSALARG